ncbi:M16 family metallopeptidase [Hwanghaeella sp.]|uniref:M16 family metallopeptidase n=1 Tax=Hwanghaeella sp. TaxID=2605943 RepID=UPI003CCC2651
MTGPSVGVLPNGLRVVTDTVLSVETVSIGVWVGTGTRSETPANNGVAHFLEHMAFKGTARRSAIQIAEEIEAVGGHMNAYTSRESTAYYVKLLKEDARLAVDVLSDILQNPSFDQEELERERSVILQEIGQVQDTPDDILFDHFQETAFEGQAMGYPTLGRPETVTAMTRDQLTAFMESGYHGGNMILVGSGKITHAELMALAEEFFATLPAGAPAQRPPSRYTGGLFTENRPSEQVHLLMGFPGVGIADDQHYAASVLSTLFGGGMSSRLFQEVREKRGLVYSVYSFSSVYSDAGLFGIYAGTGEKETAELVPVLCEEIRKLPATITEQELTRAKAQMKSSTVMALESTAARAEQLGNQMLLAGRPVPVEEQIARIDALTVDEVAGLARRIFSGPLTLAGIGPLGSLESYDGVRGRLAA